MLRVWGELEPSPPAELALTTIHALALHCWTVLNGSALGHLLLCRPLCAVALGTARAQAGRRAASRAHRECMGAPLPPPWAVMPGRWAGRGGRLANCQCRAPPPTRTDMQQHRQVSPGNKRPLSFSSHKTLSALGPQRHTPHVPTCLAENGDVSVVTGPARHGCIFYKPVNALRAYEGPTVLWGLGPARVPP